MKDNGKAVAGYVRVSSNKQDTARQEKRIQATGEPISLWFRDADGRNPRDLPEKREAFQQMLRAVQAGLVDQTGRLGKVEMPARHGRIEVRHLTTPQSLSGVSS